MRFDVLAAVFVLGLASPAYPAEVWISVEHPDGSQVSYQPAFVLGMTAEEAMKAASAGAAGLRWSADWYGDFASYIVTSINGHANSGSKYWQYCVGTKGLKQEPADIGVSTHGLWPNAAMTWKQAEFGKLVCPEK